MDLFITQGSCVLKGRGNFPGHRPNPSERVKRTAEEVGVTRRRLEITASRAAGDQLTCVCSTRRQKETRANVWRLFAEAAGGLMSLKGQTPLRKINGISLAWGGGWGSAL